MVLLKQKPFQAILMALISRKGNSTTTHMSRKEKVMTKNQIDWQQTKETAIHNRIMEAYTGESNRTNLLSMQEAARNNMAVVSENSKHNRAYESETNRHNVMSENVSQQQNVINQQHLIRSDETARQSVLETSKHNRTSEGISKYQATTNAEYQGRTASVAETNAESTIIKNANDYNISAERNRIQRALERADVKLKAAQTAKTYVNIGTDIFSSVTRGVNDYTKSVGNLVNAVNPIGGLFK